MREKDCRAGPLAKRPRHDLPAADDASLLQTLSKKIALLDRRRVAPRREEHRFGPPRGQVRRDPAQKGKDRLNETPFIKSANVRSFSI
jgi:hypothetical protein